MHRGAESSASLVKGEDFPPPLTEVVNGAQQAEEASASEAHLTETTFEQFALPAPILQGLASCGFKYMTPVQEKTVGLLLEGRDVAAQARTGSGKTIAFLVPIFKCLLNKELQQRRRPNQPRALVIAPTRELALQIGRDAKSLQLDRYCNLVVVYGGSGYKEQGDTLQRNPDLVVATPGRLMDYLRQHLIDLSAVEILVIDEADRMFDMGFIRDLRFIFNRLPPVERRQNMVFSATLSPQTLEFAYEHMNSPEAVEVNKTGEIVDRVEEKLYMPGQHEKLPLLINLLKRPEIDRALVFVNTRMAVERLSENLIRRGVPACGISGLVLQRKRERLLEGFRSGEIKVLIATDLVGRGLHVPKVSHVFNYDLPHQAENYVHRIGRTARIGARGVAVSFACDRYGHIMPDIEKYVGHKLPVEPITDDMLVMPARDKGADNHPHRRRRTQRPRAKG
jgi:ATP-dependent RNA helicase RhlB